ncbi:hypothetical protein CMI37_05025 [Candidatus Pacearchaeota archaeon]|nr:hypothetical protein [Candidatus Pacearchaeota archaeon]|tara:strand:+ start:5899 stop:6186 length:288 start_codon:yes stop_codon:yes gene_type:complete
MAVLIRRNWSKPFDQSDAKVTAAFLPSGEILLPPDREDDREGLEKVINSLKEKGVNEDGIFGHLRSIYRTPIMGDMYLIDDTDFARKEIQEGGLQ